jgi:hypothetical protein
MLVHGIRTYWNSSQFFKVAYLVNDQMPTFAFNSIVCHKSTISSWSGTLWIESTNMWKKLIKIITTSISNILSYKI